MVVVFVVGENFNQNDVAASYKNYIYNDSEFIMINDDVTKNLQS